MSDEWNTHVWMGGHGCTAYEAYRATVNSRTYDDKPMPRWSSLTGTQRAAWTMAALAAIARHSNATEGTDA